MVRAITTGRTIASGRTVSSGRSIGSSRSLVLLNPLTDLTNQVTWLKADGLLWQLSTGTTTVSSDADPVGYISDHFGQGHPFTQATASKRPLYKTGIQNGKPVLRFDGTDDFASGTLAALSGVSAFSIMGVFASTSGSLSASRILDGASSAIDIFQVTANTMVTRVDVSNTATTTYNSTAFRSNIRVFDGTQTGNANRLKCWLNGVAESVAYTGTIPAVSASGTGFVLGSRASAASNFWAGDFCELIICAEAWGDTKVAAISEYARSRWGTP